MVNWSLYANIAIKLIVTVLLLLVYVKVSGKSQLAPATTFDQIGNIVVGAIGGTTLLNPEVSVIDSTVFMSIWIFILLVIRFLRARSVRVKEFIDGKRVRLMEEGKLLPDNFKRLNITPATMEMSMHSSGLNGINQARNIWVEPNGQMTFDKKGDEKMSILLIEDGMIDHDGLEALSQDEEWLSDQLRKSDVEDIGEVFCAEWMGGKLWVYYYEDAGDIDPSKQRAIQRN